MSEPESLTQLLVDWGGGSREALEKLTPVVYVELRRLAKNYLRRERNNHTLQPTALVHEAYLRLIDQRSARWQNRAHFFGVAAQIMRRILVDHARLRNAAKRGGPEYNLSLGKADHIGHQPEVDLLALDDCLNRLAAIDRRKSEVVEMRFFAGLTAEETGAALGISRATVEREWTLARAWLRRELGG